MEKPVESVDESRTHRISKRAEPSSERALVSNKDPAISPYGDPLWERFRDALERSDHQRAVELMLIALDEIESSLREACTALEQPENTPLQF